MKTIKKAQKGTSLKDYVNKSFKTVDSLRNANPKYGSKGLRGMVEETRSNRAKADSIEKAVEKRVGVPRKMNLYEQKNGGITKKAKSGASFPDLNKDGKITKADILKGRGVIKNGGKMKKARGGATLSPSKSSVSKGLGSSKRLKSGGTLSPSKKAVSKRLASAHTRIAKKGASMKKCRGGCY